MEVIDVLALVFVLILLVESVIWVVNPELLLSLAEYLYDRPVLNQILHGTGAVVVLILVAQATSIEIVLATSLFVGLLGGLIVSPFGSKVIPVVRRTIRQQRVWPHLVVPWLIMLVIAGWAILSLFDLL